MIGGDDSIPVKKLDALNQMNAEIRRKSPGSRLFDEREIMFDPPEDLPAEPHVWDVLSRPKTTPAEIRRLCQTSIYLIGPLNPWGRILHKYAREFCDSKDPRRKDMRYPGARVKRSMLRPSSEDKRADYLARILAGFSLGKDPPLSPATADRLLRDLHRKAKHGERCPCWRCVLKRPPSFPEAEVIEEWRLMEKKTGVLLFQKGVEAALKRYKQSYRKIANRRNG